MLDRWVLGLFLTSALSAGNAFAFTHSSPSACDPSPAALLFNRTVAIVDAYSTGRHLAPRFREAGYNVVHIQSEAHPIEELFHSFQPQDFSFNLIYDGDLRKLVEDLRHHNVKAVLPGTETGIFLSDEVTNLLHQHNPEILTNGVEMARRNKHLMSTAMKNAGLDSINETLTDNVEAAIQFVREKGLLTKGSRAVVVKPVMSAATQGFHLCQSEADIRRAFENLIGSKDLFRKNISEVLVQEYLEGIEYVVNTTSLEGDHKVTDIWKYNKRLTPDGVHMIYDFDELLPSRGEVQERAIAYALASLDALRIKSGNGHIELKDVPGRGFVLIEANNRMMGQNQPVLAGMAIGASQIDRTVTSIAEPHRFHREVPKLYEWKKHAVVITLANLVGPAKIRPEISERLKHLPGYVYHSLEDEGKVLEPTTNMLNAIGYIWLMHEDPDVIKLSLEIIREMEREGKFLLQVQAP